MIPCALPRDCEAQEGEWRNSISPTVLNQREADRYISLRHPGCADLANTTEDIGSTSLVLLVCIKVSLTKGLLGVNKPRNTKDFPLNTLINPYLTDLLHTGD